MTASLPFDSDHYAAYTTKAIAVATIRQAAAEQGCDIDSELKRLYISVTSSGWADSDTITEAGYLAILDTGDPVTVGS